MRSTTDNMGDVKPSTQMARRLHRLRPLLLLGGLLVLFWLTPELWARLGGGGGYSGGGGGGGGSSSSGGGGGGGDAEAIIWLIEMWARFCIRYPYIGLPLTGFGIYGWWRIKDNEVESVMVAPARVQWNELRKHDENFSEVLFRDFGYSLFAKIHEARGSGKLSRYRNYLQDRALTRMENLSQGIQDVQGVVVGGMQVDRLKVPAGPNEYATVRLRYDANYTEITQRGARSVYIRQAWHLSRRAGALSPSPEIVSALGCVGCGSAVEPAPDGTCPHCGNQYERGEHHWVVTGIHDIYSREVGPPLTSKADDVGYDLATVMDPDLDASLAVFMQAHPNVDLTKINDRLSHIYFTLQKAWSSQDLDALRPFETDCLFQNHKYWIEEYRRQGLQNILEEVKLNEVELVKLRSDKFYDAITYRLRASMVDYTVNAGGDVMCGSKRKSTTFSEYWTLVRGRECGDHDKGDGACPNCGAELKISMAGECEYCGSKLTSGQFDWVLSEIQQDEEYNG